jgi:type IV secretion system protein VirB5
MKRAVLVATLAAAPFAASAQGIPTYDNAQIIQRAAQFGQDMEQARRLYSVSMSTRDQVAGVWRASTGGRPMDALAQVLGMFGIFLPGLQSGDVMQALSGASSYGQAANTARVLFFAEPNGQDEEAREMALRRMSLANRWEDAKTAYRAAEQRLEGIKELRDRAGRTADLQESAALQNRIAAEQAALQNDSDRTQRMLAMQATQAQVEALRDREAGRQSSERWYQASARAWNVRW